MIEKARDQTRRHEQNDQPCSRNRSELQGPAFGQTCVPRIRRGDLRKRLKRRVLRFFCNILRPESPYAGGILKRGPKGGPSPPSPPPVGLRLSSLCLKWSPYNDYNYDIFGENSRTDNNQLLQRGARFSLLWPALVPASRRPASSLW